MKEYNQHKISMSLLKSIKYIDKKHYELVNSITLVKDKNSTYYSIRYDSVTPEFFLKQTIKPFSKKMRQFFVSEKPRLKISSIYNQSIFRTKTIDDYISKYRKDEKTLVA